MQYHKEAVVHIITHPRASLMLCVMLGGVLVGLLSYSVWTWYRDWQLISQSVPIIILPDTIKKARDLVADLPQRHLFGVMADATAIPLTRLHLRVEGLLSVPRYARSRAAAALIALDEQPAKVYHVGDALPFTGIKVYDITAQSVVLDHYGRLEQLRLLRPLLPSHPVTVGRRHD